MTASAQNNPSADEVFKKMANRPDHCTFELAYVLNTQTNIWANLVKSKPQGYVH